MTKLTVWIALFLALPSAVLAGAAEVTEMRLWRAPDHTRIVFDLSAPAEHRVFSLSNPDRLVIDVSVGKLKADIAALDLASSPVRKIRHAMKDSGELRVVLDLRQAVKPKSFFLPRNGKHQDRLVLDLYDEITEPRVVKSVQQAKKRDVVIAIDAGHGGEDPGASGPGKLREKTVVLAIARKLQRMIDQSPGYRAFMVRDGDYYVPLHKRRELARKANADLLVSVHADAFEIKQANGSSVYALSHKAATSASAKFLAQSANESDLVGGVTLSDKEDVLAGVLADLSMTASLEASLELGEKVLKQMGGHSRLHSRRVEQANFAVLKSPDVPSILVETGFISNPGEARKLATGSYQLTTARAIFKGINDHFSQSPPPDTWLAARKRGDIAVSRYVVESGDTLSVIARKHKVSVDSLRNRNALNDSFIRVGQILNIPSS